MLNTISTFRRYLSNWNLFFFRSEKSLNYLFPLYSSYFFFQLILGVVQLDEKDCRVSFRLISRVIEPWGNYMCL